MDKRLDLISDEGEKLLALGREDLDRGVPQYPEWTIRDLLAHTGSILARTVVICIDRVQERISAPRMADDGDALDWFGSNLEELCEVLSVVDHDTPVWGFGPQPSVDSWVTRMLIEVGVHRWDGEEAFGRPIPLLDAVAEAGLDEFEDMWYPRLGQPSTIEVVAVDLGRSWQFGPGDPVHVVEANSSDLYLRLMSRTSPVKLPHDWAEAVDGLSPPPR